MKWQMRFLKNGAFGALPSGLQQRVRTLKRAMAPYPTAIDPWVLEQGLRQIEMLRAVGFETAGKTVLELGTGWQPTIPLLFHLVGVSRVVLVDAQKLLDCSSLVGTAANLAARAGEIAPRIGAAPQQVAAKLLHPDNGSLQDALESFGFDYLAPCNLLTSELPSGSLDAVISRAVLEHIPPAVIKRIFAKLHDLLKEGGKMCLIIDNSDHWEHEDKSITCLNYLKYSDNVFKILSSMNPLDYQNRLRHSQYLAMLESCGFSVELDRSVPDRKGLQSLQSVNIHKNFAPFSQADLATLTSYLVAKKS